MTTESFDETALRIAEEVELSTRELGQGFVPTFARRIRDELLKGKQTNVECGFYSPDGVCEIKYVNKATSDLDEFSKKIDQALQEPVAWWMKGVNNVDIPEGTPLFTHPASLTDIKAAAEKLGCVVVPREPTEGMVSAYLKANDGYWQKTDAFPRAPTKWRTGTPRQATAESYKAMIAAAQKGE